MEILGLPYSFTAYARKNSFKIDAIFDSETPETWDKIRLKMDYYNKNLQQLDNGLYRATFTNIEEPFMLEKLIKDAVQFKLASMALKK